MFNCCALHCNRLDPVPAWSRAVVEQSHELRISLLHPLTGGLFSRPLEALVVAASSECSPILLLHALSSFIATGSNVGETLQKHMFRACTQHPQLI